MKIFRLALLLFTILILLSGCSGSGDNSLSSALPDEDSTGGTPVDPPSGGDTPVVPAQPEPGVLGDLLDLGDLVAPDGNPPPGDGWYYTEAIAINDSGTVVGQSNSGTPTRGAFSWNPESGMTFLGIHLGYYDDPYDINYERAELPRKPFLYSIAVDINSSGTIIGNSTRGEDEKRAFIWKDGFATDLSPPTFWTKGKEFPDSTIGYSSTGDYLVAKSFSEAVDINDKGEVVLTAENATGKRAYYWNGEDFIDEEVYYFDEDGPTGPVAIKVPVLIALGKISGEDATAVAINENGQAVANSGDTAVFTDLNWGVIEPLNYLPGKTKTVAVDINDSIYSNHDGIPDGHIIGNSGNDTLKIGEDDSVQGFFWDGGAMYPIDFLVGGTSVATDINNKDQVVGGATTADGSIHAYIWALDSNKKGVIKDLGTLGGKNSFATAINEAGQVVGWSETEGSNNEQGVVMPIRHAFLWQDGVMYDLGTHDNFYQYPFNPSFPFSEAAAINGSGQVAGNSLTINAHSRGFVLTPTFP